MSAQRYKIEIGYKRETGNIVMLFNEPRNGLIATVKTHEMTQEECQTLALGLLTVLGVAKDKVPQ